MPATLREFLIFDVTTSQTGFFQLLNCSGDIFCTTKTRVRIDNRGTLHPVRNVTGQLRHFCEGPQTNVRNSPRRVGHSRTAAVNRLETTSLALSRHPTFSPSVT